MILVIRILYILYVNWWTTHNADADVLDSIVDTVVNFTLPSGPLQLPNIDPVLDPVMKKLVELVNDRVYFIIFDNESPDGLTYRLNDRSNIQMDLNKPTKIIIHGWSNDQHSGMPTSLRQKYFANISNLNIIIIDWSEISKIVIYPLPANGTTLVGECIADFLLNLYANTDNKNFNVHFIGHSLGAHVSGFASRKLRQHNYLPYRITGLDPANPLIQNGLSSDDAGFVDVIHTSSGTLGIAAPLGHADFYPNGGNVPQPGCTGLTSSYICSHSRSWEYYFRTIQNPQKYIAYRCSSYSDFLINKCNDNDITYMGEGASTASRGVYYLNATL